MSRELKQAQLRLADAIANNRGVTPCRNRSEWTVEPQPLLDTLDVVEACRLCPVLAECAAVADQMQPYDRAHSVMAGRRYDAAGRPVELTVSVKHLKHLRRMERRTEGRDTARAARADLVEEGAA